MKKNILALALLSGLTLSAFAEPQSVECSTSKDFGENTCEVCYTDNFEATETQTGWTSNITNVKIPWKHNGGELDEIIYDNEQKLPEIKSTLTVTTKPTKPEDLWTNHESLIWTPFSDHKEVFIKDGDEIGLYKLQDKAGITVTGKKPEDTILFVTPLVVRDFDSKTNEDSDPVTRNICVQGKFTVKKVAPAVITPEPIVTPTTLPVTPEPAVVEETITTEEALEAPENTDETTDTTIETGTELNAAGPESETVITADQTKTQTGPILWITLLLAFVFASAWNAWKKQKA
ncbi:hypothetical protein H6768_03380 [Candidatus Peribacteria bacterium]|nr:hypothetical protein [Candidatus Peribacteria bacterium]